MRARFREFLVLLFACVAARAQQLPFQHYDVNNGLAHSRVNSIAQDRKGYLWFCTWEGLSRFDGYTFVNYGRRDGLKSDFIDAVAEDPAGRLWVGTNGEIARLLDEPVRGRKFASYAVAEPAAASNIDRLAIDADGNLWCLTEGGLYRARVDADGNPRFTPVRVVRHPLRSRGALFIDSNGTVWAELGSALMRVDHGRVSDFPLPPGTRPGEDIEIAEDARKRLLVSGASSLFAFDPSAPDVQSRWKKQPLTLRASQVIGSIAAAPDGALWLGTNEGLVHWRDGEQVDYGPANGLRDATILALYKDRDANLWVGTSSGVSRLSTEPIISYTTAEGIPEPFVARVVESRDGRLYASTVSHGIVEIARGRAVPVAGSEQPPFAAVGKRFMQDQRGDWWVGTDIGLYRFDGPALQFRRGRKFAARDGVPEVPVFGGYSICEAPDGKIWVSLIDGNLYWYDPGEPSRGFQHRPLNAVDPATNEPVAGIVAIGSDPGGTLWLGSLVRYFARLRNGSLVPFRATHGLPDLGARAFYEDHRGWFWVGLRYGGVSFTKSPAADSPAFTNISAADGLASDTVWSLVEDRYGRMYLGTGKGLDQLEPISRRLRHFDRDDGLAGNLINDCIRDHDGNIWVATSSGVSRYVPDAQAAAPPAPPVYFGRIDAGERPLPLPERGAMGLADVVLPSSRSNLVIDYVAPNFGSPQAVRYEYRLDGVDRRWSAPTEQREVNYAHLAPGAYRFQVRAVTPEGNSSREAAAFTIRILRPLWQRPWFIVLATATVFAAAFWIYGFRMRHLLLMERLRTQIATDLHDDIGPALSQVAILSEVLKRDSVPAATGSLDEIANLARGMRESMSEIVWAVDPRKDHLVDLVQRMRQVAFNLFASDAVNMSVEAPDERQIERIVVGPDRRRHLLLMFKEALNNVVRHADAHQVVVQIAVEGSSLRVSIVDDGRGFDPSRDHEGHGLRSMRRRASEMRANLKVYSSPGSGTSIEVNVPLQRT